ncbi:MAG TPA: trypco2 family protein [Dehalococcoidia bacterium]|nr:trypco2 family protein [Dehalococcoidia bacterium]
MADIPLAELIEEVTSQLRSAARKAENKEHVMQFAECEIEVGFEAERNTDGKLDLKVFSLGHSRKKSESNTIKVKFVSIDDKVLAYIAQNLGGTSNPIPITFENIEENK